MNMENDDPGASAVNGQFEVNNHDELLYNIGDLEEIIQINFGTNQENLPDQVEFVVDVELEEGLVDQQSVMNHKSVNKNSITTI